MRIIVLTDTTEYGAEATFYPLVRALAARPEADRVYVADRVIPENGHFYKARDTRIRQIHARIASGDYSFETRESAPVVSVPVTDADAVWMRIDLPGDSLLRYTETLWGDRFISNRPSGIIRTGTKAFLLSLQPLLGDLMPRIKLCHTADGVMEFRRQCPDMVLKVLNSFGGKGVVRFRANGPGDLQSEQDVRQFLADNGACLAMEYLDHPQQSDNRLIVSNGVILGAIRRVPKPGDWLCNLMAGGSYDMAEPDDREVEIVRRIDAPLRQLGIHYYGVDTLLDSRSRRVLSEVNTINAGGAYRYELKTGKPVCRRIADDFLDNALASLPRSGRPSTPLP